MVIDDCSGRCRIGKMPSSFAPGRLKAKRDNATKEMYSRDPSGDLVRGSCWNFCSRELQVGEQQQQGAEVGLVSHVPVAKSQAGGHIWWVR